MAGARGRASRSAMLTTPTAPWWPRPKRRGCDPARFCRWRRCRPVNHGDHRGCLLRCYSASKKFPWPRGLFLWRHTAPDQVRAQDRPLAGRTWAEKRPRGRESLTPDTPAGRENQTARPAPVAARITSIGDGNQRLDRSDLDEAALALAPAPIGPLSCTVARPSAFAAQTSMNNTAVKATSRFSPTPFPKRDLHNETTLSSTLPAIAPYWPAASAAAPAPAPNLDPDARRPGGIRVGGGPRVVPRSTRPMVQPLTPDPRPRRSRKPMTGPATHAGAATDAWCRQPMPGPVRFRSRRALAPPWCAAPERR